jgi:hypothetical protein
LRTIRFQEAEEKKKKKKKKGSRKSWRVDDVILKNDPDCWGSSHPEH